MEVTITGNKSSFSFSVYKIDLFCLLCKILFCLSLSKEKMEFTLN